MVRLRRSAVQGFGSGVAGDTFADTATGARGFFDGDIENEATGNRGNQTPFQLINMTLPAMTLSQPMREASKRQQLARLIRDLRNAWCSLLDFRDAQYARGTAAFALFATARHSERRIDEAHTRSNSSSQTPNRVIE